MRGTLSAPLDFPATLVRAQDELAPYGRRLARLRRAADEHPDGHRFPAAAGWYTEMAAAERGSRAWTKIGARFCHADSAL